MLTFLASKLPVTLSVRGSFAWMVGMHLLCHQQWSHSTSLSATSPRREQSASKCFLSHLQKLFKACTVCCTSASLWQSMEFEVSTLS